MSPSARLERCLRRGAAMVFLLCAVAAAGVAPWLPTVPIPVIGTPVPLAPAAVLLAVVWGAAGAACMLVPFRWARSGAPRAALTWDLPRA